VKAQEVQFHHEVYNQFLWNQFWKGSRNHSEGAPGDVPGAFFLQRKGE
jgi:hypothetical protein